MLPLLDVDPTRGITVSYLQPYSPELNAIEAYFGVIKRQEMHQRSYRTLEELESAINIAFQNQGTRLLTNPPDLPRGGA